VQVQLSPPAVARHADAKQHSRPRPVCNGAWQVEHAVPLAKALVAGGITVVELTLRTEVGAPPQCQLAPQWQ